MRARFFSKAFFFGLGAWIADLAGTFDEAPTTSAPAAARRPRRRSEPRWPTSRTPRSI